MSGTKVQRTRSAAGTGGSKPARAALELAPASRQIAASATLAMNEAVARRRAAGRETLHLAFGQASFPLPPLLRAALAGAAGATGYAPVLGIPELRTAIAAYLTRTRGLRVAPEQVIVGPGSKPLLYALLQVLAGDLLLPVPSWVSYAPQARLAGRRVIPVATDPTDHHRLTPRALTAALEQGRAAGADPRILLVNTPSNPTGGMFARADVVALADWARARDVTLISDEIYAELAHGWRDHVSPACCYLEGTIVTGGLSKGFSAGGWRLGYAVVPTGEAGARLTGAVRALASEVWSAASAPIQQAAVVAYTPHPEIAAYLRRAARLSGHVARHLHASLRRLGVPCPQPAGAFYLYPDFAPWRASLARLGVATSTELAAYLLERWDLATLPGVEFGEPPEALRLRLATSMLVEPAATLPPAARDAAAWELLARADTLPPPSATDDEDGSPDALDLPELARVEGRFAAVIQALAAPPTHASSGSLP